MRIITHRTFCDRCKVEIDGKTSDTGFGMAFAIGADAIHNQMSSPKYELPNEMYMCHKCEREFINWMKQGEKK